MKMKMIVRGIAPNRTPIAPQPSTDEAKLAGAEQTPA